MPVFVFFNCDEIKVSFALPKSSSLLLSTNNSMTGTWYSAIIPARDISKLSKYHSPLLVFWTILKYHSRYYCQIPLQVMLLPVLIQKG